MTIEVSSTSKNIFRSYTICHSESDQEQEVYRRDNSQLPDESTRLDFININSDISDYTLITFVTSNGEKCKEIGEYASASFNIEFEESFLNNDDGVIDTGHVYKTYNQLIKDIHKKQTPEFLQKNGVCVSSIVSSADELIVSSLGDIHIYLFQEVDGKQMYSLINSVHSNEDKVEKEKMLKSGYAFDDGHTLKVTRCVGNDQLVDQQQHNKPDVVHINMRSMGEVQYKCLLMMSNETVNRVDVQKLFAFINTYIQPKNPSTVIKTVFSQLYEIKLSNDAGCFVMFFKND